jgi:hypothetical protein
MDMKIQGLVAKITDTEKTIELMIKAINDTQKVQETMRQF